MAESSSGYPSESSETADGETASELRRLRKELERERHKNGQLEDKLKRQAKAQELMVSKHLPSLPSPRRGCHCAARLPPRASLPGLVRS